MLAAATPARVCAAVNVLLVKPVGNDPAHVRATLKLFVSTPTVEDVAVTNPVAVAVVNPDPAFISPATSVTILALVNVPSNILLCVLPSGNVVVSVIMFWLLSTPAVTTLTLEFKLPPNSVSV